MRIDCNIDGKNYSLSVNSQKPLLQILIEDMENESMKSVCSGATCGNCIVLLDSQAVLSCLVPAFRLKGSTIQTFDSFRKTRLFRDIDRAYREVGSVPCQQCFASKTLIIESILQSMEKQIHSNNPIESSRLRRQSELETIKKERDQFIITELSINSCTCTESSEMIKVVNTCFEYRRRRNVRRS